MISFSNLKGTIRHLFRNKLYLSVNILSLSVGLICCLFAFKYVQDEWGYDRFHKASDRIYRVEYEAQMDDGQTSRFANLHGSVLPEQISSIPEIELNTRFTPHADLNVEVSGQEFGESEVIAANASFFDVFSFDFIEGLPGKTLASPNSVVLTKSTAEKYFNTSRAAGKTLKLRFQGQEVLLTVTGVIENVPSNSHFTFDLVTSSKAYEQLYEYDIRDIQMGYNYIRIFEGGSAKQIEDKLDALINQEQPELTISYHLRALTDIHLYSTARAELSQNGNINYLYLLAIISLVILSIACVNFTMLTTARSVKRATEIGIRKVYGALRSHLISSFLIEGILLSAVGLFLAYLFMWEFLPYINNFTNKSFAFSEFVHPGFLSIMIVTTLLAGSIAGIYPALVLTGYRPSKLLTKQSSIGLRGNSLWKSIIVIQFTATLILIAASYIIHQQIDFIQNKDLGFSKEQVVTIPNYFGGNPQTFLNELEQHPNIKSVTASSYIPGVSTSSGTALVETEDTSTKITFDWISVDHQYLQTYNIALQEGRNFSEQRNSDYSGAFLINETAVNKLGWNRPIGKPLSAFGRTGYVIGVVEDFNFLSLHNKISPLIILIDEQYYFSVSAKLRSIDQAPETISYIQKTWDALLPGAMFTYGFVDDRFARVYQAEQRAQKLFMVFSALAVSIAILGLFSFASFSVQQKQGEIGIRKVLGATVYDVLQLFYTDYFKLLLTAFALASPIVFIWMRNWLQSFSYKTSFGLDMLAIPLLISVMAILLSVSYQVIKSAFSNPADTIRSE